MNQHVSNVGNALILLSLYGTSVVAENTPDAADIHKDADQPRLSLYPNEP